MKPENFHFLLRMTSRDLVINVLMKIYYSKFDKGQNFNFVCRRSCISDTKNFMIDMYNNYHFTNMLAFVSIFCKLFLQRNKKHQPTIKLQLCMVATFSNFVICPLSPVHRTAEMYS